MINFHSLMLKFTRGTFHGYQKIFHSPTDYQKYRRTIEGRDRARIFQISDLLNMWKASREGGNGPPSSGMDICVGFMCSRKAKAADLKLGDTEVPLHEVSGQMLVVGELPKYLYMSGIPKQTRMVKVTKAYS